MGDNYSILIAVFASLGAYLVASFARVHLGSCYPSDCLLTLPLVLIVIGLAYGLHYLGNLSDCNGCG